MSSTRKPRRPDSSPAGRAPRSAPARPPAAADAVVVGAGPNGLAAAITLARAGHSVVVLEAADTPGGGTRTEEVTLPGFRHDICSAIHPLALASPFFKQLPLAQHGVEFVHPGSPLAHPLDDGSAAVLQRSVEETGRSLGRDAGPYSELMTPLARAADDLVEQFLGPLRLPRHPVDVTRFGLRAVRSAEALATATFDEDQARAMFAGMAAHSMLRLDRPTTAGFGLLLGLLGHVVGWPAARGGSQRIAEAMTGVLRSLGGEVVTGWRVASMRDVPAARAVIFDVTPRQLIDIAADYLPQGYLRRLGRFRYGPGVFKVDLALERPVPWKAEACAAAGTVHVGGRLEEIAHAEAEVAAGRHPERPFVLVGQQSSFDPTRAPEGKHTLWAYCHVPNGSTVDMTARIEDQIERFAPGFKDLVLARHTTSPAQLQDYNANYVGGDINGGVQDLGQLFTRPVARASPYTTPARDVFICSSSTPPGGGVHGMCGYYAARAALRRAF